MKKILIAAYALVLMCTVLWTVTFLWIHQWGGMTVTLLICGVFIGSMLILLQLYRRKHEQQRYAHFSYWFFFGLLLVIFFCMKPSNTRDWSDEVDKIISFRFVDGQVEINNIRNFIWDSEDHYTTQWETRRYDIEQLESVDLIISHFIPGPVAHVFISFGFKNGEHLAFSLEVRQEKDEGFSSLGGFFRQYELALVVGDENDLIYARTNTRDEDVYIYPIQMDRTEIQLLFLEYLSKANRLDKIPRWYNTLISNCTTILFDLTEHATGEIQRDYRVLLPGLLPHYLYDKGQLDQNISFDEWKKRAHVNPKTKHLNNGPDHLATPFSKLIRQPDIPEVK